MEAVGRSDQLARRFACTTAIGLGRCRLRINRVVLALHTSGFDGGCALPMHRGHLDPVDASVSAKHVGAGMTTSNFERHVVRGGSNSSWVMTVLRKELKMQVVSNIGGLFMGDR
jgi:hypothetical protein